MKYIYILYTTYNRKSETINPIKVIDFQKPITFMGDNAKQEILQGLPIYIYKPIY